MSGIVCGRCHKSEGFTQNKMKKQMTCNNCNYIFTDEQVIEAFGLVKCPDGSFESASDKWKEYPCPYCMTFFKTFDERVQHQTKNHKIGDYMRCMET